MKNLLFIVSLPLLTIFAGCQEGFDARLAREAKEMSEKHCPQEPEPGTRLDSFSYDKTSRIYTTWYSLTDTNVALLESQGALLHERIVQQLRSNVDYKAVKDEGVVFRYVYRRQSTGCVVFETSVKREEYQ